MTEDTVHCPCYPICSSLGIETGQWCRYRESDLPPPGVHTFNPKDTWCPPGVQANVLMLAYLVARGDKEPSPLARALARVRQWAAADVGSGLLSPEEP